MRGKKMLLLVLLIIGLLAPSVSSGASFYTSFNNPDLAMDGIEIGNGDWTIPYPYVWPTPGIDDAYNNKAYLSASPSVPYGRINMIRNMTIYNIQCGRIFFQAPYGITGHLVIAVQTTFGPNCPPPSNPNSPNGYFAFLGHEGRLGPPENTYLAIEKAYKNASGECVNDLHDGQQVVIDPNKVYSLHIETYKYSDHMTVAAHLCEVHANEELWFVAEAYYTDWNGDSDGNYIKGKRSFFATVFQPDPIIWDEYYVLWQYSV